MIDPLNLPNAIIGSIMQNFPDMQMLQGSSSATETARIDRVDGAENTVGGMVSSFSETLAERLSESSSLENYEIRSIINEELAAAVGDNSTELVQLLHRMDGNLNNPMALFTSLMGGDDRSDVMAMLNMLNRNNNPLNMLNLPSSFSGMANSSAMMGVADPFDALFMYGSMLRR